MPPGNLIDGRAIAEQIHQETARRIARLQARGIVPRVVFVRVGDDAASRVYVGMKEKTSARLGISSRTCALAATTPEKELLGFAGAAQRGSRCARHSGAVPAARAYFRGQNFCRRRARKKTWMVFIPSTRANCCWERRHGFRPCTPAGIHELLIRSGVAIAGGARRWCWGGATWWANRWRRFAAKGQARRGHGDRLPFPNARHCRRIAAAPTF